MSTSVMGEASSPFPDLGLEFRQVIGDSAPGSTEGKGRTDDGRISCVLDDGQGFFQGPGETTVGHIQADAMHGLRELLPVLRHLDGLGVGPDELNPVFFQEPPLMKLHGQVQRGLPTHGGEERVGFFRQDDPLHPGRSQGFDVGPVGQVRIRHDGGGIRVHENDPEPLLLEGFYGLGSRVIELAGLPNDDGP